ncbi:MAG: LysM peptidoglycan-binding domain-containing protein [Desulfobacteraceae bacterium]|nr:LysM peptidoglycan-binding domain-containing protein [Desulfobacteraceae bacterium]
MPKPAPGTPYIVQSGDTLKSIASRAYGDAFLYPRIKAANDGLWSLQAGQKLIIPALPERQQLKTAAYPAPPDMDDADAPIILIDGLRIRPETVSVLRTIDTGADAWTGHIEWTPGDDNRLDAVLKPFAYPVAAVYIGGELIVNGLLYTVRPATGNRRHVGLEGFSFSADAVDSTLTPPYEFNNTTLEQRAKAAVAPLGIDAVFEADSGGPFGRITAEPEDTIFDHLYSLAVQRGLLLTCTTQGDLLFTIAKTGPAVGTLAENEPSALSWSACFDGRKRFNTYRAYGYSPLAGKKAVTATDDNVPRSRVLTFAADDTTTGNINKAAEWRRSKQTAQALSVDLTVAGWRAPDKSLWRPNTLVTVVSETLMLPAGYTFLIRSVEFSLCTAGKQTHLSLVPPGVYTKEKVNDPWSYE